MFMPDPGVTTSATPSSMVLVSRYVHRGDDVDDVSAEQGHALGGAWSRRLGDGEAENRVVDELVPADQL